VTTAYAICDGPLLFTRTIGLQRTGLGQSFKAVLGKRGTNKHSDGRFRYFLAGVRPQKRTNLEPAGTFTKGHSFVRNCPRTDSKTTGKSFLIRLTPPFKLKNCCRKLWLSSSKLGPSIHQKTAFLEYIASTVGCLHFVANGVG